MAEAQRGATAEERAEATHAWQAAGPAQAAETSEGEVTMTHPTGPAGPGPSGGAGTGPGRSLALVVQALALIATGLVLVVAALTAPPAPVGEPLQLRWRPATAQEQQQYERDQLVALMDELRQQQNGATTAPTAVTPEARTRTNPAEEGRSR